MKKKKNTELGNRRGERQRGVFPHQRTGKGDQRVGKGGRKEKDGDSGQKGLTGVDNTLSRWINQKLRVTREAYCARGGAGGKPDGMYKVQKQKELITRSCQRGEKKGGSA